MKGGEIMKIIVYQNVFCNNTENFNNHLRIQKQYESDIIPRIGETIYNFMYKDNTEQKVADVAYNLDNNTCDITLEKMVIEFSKDNIKQLAEYHGWEVIG